jgi:hypothetical protein
VRTIHVPRFDQPGNVLVGVEVNVSGRGDGQIRVENLANSAVSATSVFRCDFALRRPDTTVLVAGSASRTFTDALAAFDGNQNYHGPSGETHSGLTVSFNATHTSPPPASDLALFSGSGSVTLTFEALDTSSVTGGSNLACNTKQDADARITIC